MIDFLSFSNVDAQKYGVDGAVMLYHVRYWVAKNEANENNLHEGQYWTYNSSKAFAILFPFYTARKIGRILAKLEEDGAIVSGNFNGNLYDRTKWFTLAIPITENSTYHLSNMVNGCTQYVEPIPKYNQVTTQDTTKKEIVFPFEGDLFAEAWVLWKQYKKEEKNFRFRSSISEQASLLDLQKISNNNEQQAIATIHRSISKGWSGLHPDKKAKAEKGFDRDKYQAHLDSF